MSAAYRLAPGAARALAGVVIGGGAAGALLLGAAWLAQHCFEKQGATWVRKSGCGGNPPPPQSTGLEYRVFNETGLGWDLTKLAACTTWFNSKTQATLVGNTTTYIAKEPHVVFSGGQDLCAFNTYYKATNVLFGENVNSGRGFSTRTASNCPVGWYITPGGCVQSLPVTPVTPQEVEDDMATKPLPQTLPPGVPYPLDPQAPSIWNPTVGDPPVTQPLRVPQGNPIRIPNSDPAKYRQPVTDVTHSPTADDPWRMDVQPKEIETDSPTGQQSPQSLGSGAPQGTPREETPDLCVTNPEIVACSKLDTPEGEIPKETKNITFAAETPFGGGSCPADRMFSSVMTGRSFKAWDFAQTCSYIASYVRPLVLLLATFAAFLILMPGKVET